VSAEQNAQSPARPQLYFINAWVDYALIGGGSILVFTLMRYLYTDERSPAVVLLAGYLLWVVNWPHFSATSYRLYHSRENIMQYPLTALVVPWLVLAAVIGSLASPEAIAPIFIKFYLIWSPYHFSGQTVGITLIYARRAGFTISPFQRFCLSGFVYGTFLASTMRGEVTKRNGDYHGIFCPSFCLPEWVWVYTQAFMGVCGVLFLVFAVQWCFKNKRILPPIVLVPAVAQMIWFMQDITYPSFGEFVPFFHSLQYLLIAWAMQLKDKMDRQKIAPSPAYVAWETFRWGGLNVAGGLLLFYGITAILWLSYYGYDLTRWGLTFGVVAAGVQVHHFFVDGVIWKLKRKTVASPLMVNIEEMLHGRSGNDGPVLAGAPAPAAVANAEQRA